MRSLFVFGMYIAVALFFVWRAETYVDAGGRTLLLARLMCLLLALMIAAVGILRGLEIFGIDTSSD